MAAVFEWLSFSGSTMTGYQRLCILTCFVIFGLIVLGGVVRATGSGLGCPDWPRCHGSFIPRWETSTLIEYSHRLAASVAGLLVLAILVWTWRSFRRVPALLYPAVFTLGLLLFQAGLGGAAVVNELPPEIVAVHLGVALTILTLLLVITTTSFAIAKPIAPVEVRPGFRVGTLLLAEFTLVLLLVGSYVSGAGYGLACNGWPLCNGDLFPTTNAASVNLVLAHRLLALLVGVTLLVLTWQAWRQRAKAPLPLSFLAVGAAIFVIQSLIGAANVWTRLADVVSAAHLAFATLLWVTLALLNIRVHRLHELLPHATSDEPRTGLARATR